MKSEAAVLPRTFQLDWMGLLNIAAALDGAVLLLLVLMSHDTLALFLAAAILVGLGLLRFRGGLLGLGVLALVCADTGFWTLTGAVNNFAHRETLLNLWLPSFLGTLSLVSVVAAVAAFLTRRKPRAGLRTPMWLAQATLVVLVVEAAAGVVLQQPKAPPVAPSALDLAVKDMKFSSPTLAAADGQVTLHFVNHDLWWHTFTIDELGVSVSVPMGAERDITFKAPAGPYSYYCAIPGHRSIGMEGTLTVAAP